MSKALTKTKKSVSKFKEGEDVLLSEEKTIYLIDTSGSMSERLGKYEGKSIDKIEAVRIALGAMMEARLSYLTDDHVGFIEFSGSGYGRHYTKDTMPLGPCTPKYAAHAKKLRADGGTPMFQGFERAASVLGDQDGLVRIVMMSDGEPNQGYSKGDIIDQVRQMSDTYGFIVDCIGIGIPGQTADYDEKFMKTVAEVGQGEFFPIEDVDQLVKLLKRTAIERKALFGGGIKLLGDGSQLSR